MGGRSASAGRRSTWRPRRQLWLVLTLAAAFWALAGGQAFASHLQGGYVSANINGDTISGKVVHLDVRTCVVGVTTVALPVTITAPGGQSVTPAMTGTATRCITGSSTYEYTYSLSLTTLFGANATLGNYRVTYTNNARIAGIVNLANSSTGSVSFTAQVHKGATPAGSPYLGSNIATGVGVGTTYSQNLNASDPDADPINPAALTYTTLLKPTDPNAPDYNVVSLSNTGQVTIPSTTTNTFTAGQHYVYKVRVTDDQGDYAERGAAYNLALGLRRAQTVCRYLTAHGVRAHTTTASAGETRPRASNATAAGRALNRRVELSLRY